MFPSPTLKGKVRDWLSFLNRMELANLLLAFIAFFLRLDSQYELGYSSRFPIMLY
jgi:hypothetical protein